MPTSIFADDTGRRSVRVRWAVRVVSASLLIGVAVTALSLFTHVSLPSLPNPVSNKAGTAVHQPTRSNEAKVPVTATTPSPTAATTGAAQRSTASDAAEVMPASSEPTTPVQTATGPGRSIDAPRAMPTHKPATPPVTPPGKTK